jgi:hypothetical protein
MEFGNGPSHHIGKEPRPCIGKLYRGSNFITMSKLSRFLGKDDGNVESALVLIPLLILFLVGAQIIAATNLRNIDMATVQGDAATRAISHVYQPGDQVIEVGGRIEKIQLLITHRSNLLAQIVPGLAALMGGDPVSDVMGIAVIEP